MNIALAERASRVHTPLDHNEDEEFRRRDWIVAQWQLCPAMIAFEGEGDCVIIDYCFRPIVRVFADERTEILEPDAEFRTTHGLRLLHHDFSFPPGKRAHDKIRAYIDMRGLAPELQRRRELLRRGELIGGRGW